MRFTEQTWAVVILLAVGCVTFSQPLFRHFMLDVRSVQVSNAFDGFDHALTVDREIHRPGPYTWSISFVRAERPRHSVYTAERAVPFPYVVTEDGDTLITHTLTWWIGGEDEDRKSVV